MADLSGELKSILEAVYGNQMRQAIYDAIRKMNDQVNSLSSAIDSESAGTDEDLATLTARVSTVEERLQRKIDDDEAAVDLTIDVNKLGLYYDSTTDTIYPTYNGTASIHGEKVSKFR